MKPEEILEPDVEQGAIQTWKVPNFPDLHYAPCTGGWFLEWALPGHFGAPTFIGVSPRDGRNILRSLRRNYEHTQQINERNRRSWT